MEALKDGVKLISAVKAILAYPAVSYPVAFVLGGKLYDPTVALVGDLVGKAFK